MGLSMKSWAMNASLSPASLAEDYQRLRIPPVASLLSYLALGLLGYATLCSVLRFHRVRYVQSRFNFTDRESLSRMTIQDAQAISKYTMYYEFPLFYDLSLRLALLKTYAVKNVAKVLVSVSDLAKTDEAPKRYEDTAILYTCFSNFKPDDEEFLKAVARMNFLHKPYVKSGKILNEDLLYVLWASMAEPIRFIGVFEWRELTDMEHAAVGALWKHIGDLMGIDYKAELGHDQWKDGIEFVAHVTEWAHEYEEKYLHPYPEVRKLGDVLMDLLLTSYPTFSRPSARIMAAVAVGDRLRRAFGFPEPSLGWHVLTYGLLYTRKMVLRYLTLPRFFPAKPLSDPDPKTGRMQHHHYMKEPWYNPPSLTSRWGLEAWLTWSFGGVLPGDKTQFKPEGFLFEEIGPSSKAGKGVEEVANVKHLAAMRSPNMSPFAPVG